MLRAGLSREENQLLGAVPFIVDVGYYLKARCLELAQPELSNLNSLFLLRSEKDTGLGEKLQRPFPGFFKLTSC